MVRVILKNDRFQELDLDEKLPQDLYYYSLLRGKVDSKAESRLDKLETVAEQIVVLLFDEKLKSPFPNEIRYKIAGHIFGSTLNIKELFDYGEKVFKKWLSDKVTEYHQYTWAREKDAMAKLGFQRYRHEKGPIEFQDYTTRTILDCYRLIEAVLEEFPDVIFDQNLRKKVVAAIGELDQLKRSTLKSAITKLIEREARATISESIQK